MSISLSSIDCPSLTESFLKLLDEKHSIRTIFDLFRWKNRPKEICSSETFRCVENCAIVQTGVLLPRSISEKELISFRLDFSLIDRENLLRTKRHLTFIYQDFNTNQWNKWFNTLLMRLFRFNPSINVILINTNPNLFDVKFFFSEFFSTNDFLRQKSEEIFQRNFSLRTCFHLDHFDEQLTQMENDVDLLTQQVLIIDDLFTLIRPFLGLDQRIRQKISQITYRLNRLAQERSLLVIDGLVLSSKRSTTNKTILPMRYECFHADYYLQLQSSMNTERHVDLKLFGILKRTDPREETKFDLEQWNQFQ